MNIAKYISSGIIESYILGALTAKEAAEVESYALQYPAVRDAIEESRKTIEDFTRLQSKEPPAVLKEKIWKNLQEHRTLERYEREKLISEKTLPSKSSGLKWLLAASIVALIISFFWGLSNKEKRHALENNLAASKKKQIELEKTLSQRDSIMMAYQHYSQMVAYTNVAAVVMKGVGNHSNMQATVLWDKGSKDVYLTINNLPVPPAGKQYQLWAIVNGTPVDMGVFDVGQPFQKLKTTSSAQMFAVTLEKEGGSLTPTMDQMYVAAKI